MAASSRRSASSASPRWPPRSYANTFESVSLAQVSSILFNAGDMPQRPGRDRPDATGGIRGMLQKQAQKIDKVIGRNIRIHRLAKKMSQTELGNHLGVSFQQVQKYENGTNRVGSGRLYQIAAILGLHVSAL